MMTGDTNGHMNELFSFQFSVINSPLSPKFPRYDQIAFRMTAEPREKVTSLKPLKPALPIYHR
jgi:hypothetical protein